jgi:hypothetical protein
MGIDNIPATREALWEWKTAYENEHFVYADTNKKVGDSTMGLFVRQMPSFMQPFAASAAGVFLDDKTREAFGMPRPSLFLRIAVPALTKLKGIVGHFQMPRTEPPIYAQDEVFVDDKGHQRIRRGGYLWEPWYVSPTTGTKYGLFAYNPPGEQWHPEGYRPATLGPERLMDTGVEEVTKAASEMREQARGYPFFH